MAMTLGNELERMIHDVLLKGGFSDFVTRQVYGRRGVIVFYSDPTGVQMSSLERKHKVGGICDRLIKYGLPAEYDWYLGSYVCVVSFREEIPPYVTAAEEDCEEEQYEETA